MMVRLNQPQNGRLESAEHIQKLSYLIELTDKCEKKFHKLCKKDGKLENHIESLLEELQSSPYLGEKLQVNFPGLRSIHFCGRKYRIIYKINDETMKILVVIIGHRKDAYPELARWLGQGK